MQRTARPEVAVYLSVLVCAVSAGRSSECMQLVSSARWDEAACVMGLIICSTACIGYTMQNWA